MDKQILSSKEAAAYLDISINQLYKLSSTRKLPVYSPTGGKIYFLKEELDEWVVSKRKATTKSIQAKAINLLTINTNRA
jgi:excisionase family DNA binding protein